MKASAVAKEIGIPVGDWPGNCYVIATAMVDAGLVPEGAVKAYGHYIGHVVPSSPFRAVWDAVGWVRHGWVQVTSERVIDPTRWVFEGRRPYIYDGPAHEYDRGANEHRRANLRPAPKFKASGRVYPTVGMSVGAEYLVSDLLNNDIRLVTPEQAFWIANLPIDMLGEFATEVYAWLVVCDLGGFIPIDNGDAVLGRNREAR